MRRGDGARPRPDRPRAGRRARSTGAGCRPRGCSPDSRSRRSRRRGPRTIRAETSQWNATRRSSTLGRAADRRPGGRQVAAGADARLPLAVVAEPARLQDRRRARAGRRRRASASGRPRPRTGRRESPSPAMNGFSTRRSCATSSALGDGRTGTLRGQDARRLHAHVLELVGDDVAPSGRRRPAPPRRRRRPRWSSVATSKAGPRVSQ